MLNVTICIGSSCHLKGSRDVVEKMQKFIADYGLKDRVELSGAFCMGHCQEGVCVTVDGALHSVAPETTEDFFRREVLSRFPNGR
jgi:NADH:ubiquinone oxidoreductase subunit E